MEKKDRDNWFVKSETFKEMNGLMDLETPFSEEVSGDEFIAGFMRPDIAFESEVDELQHLRSAQAILRDEILTAYAFMDKQGILKEYKEYRDE
ncbi:hypothetical protein QYZ88_007345 [Lachnospiraceae bacterium C1.1]|nr:hypothetical protein [Lachnospiraceae bacterium C1.1]